MYGLIFMWCVHGDERSQVLLQPLRKRGRVPIADYVLIFLLVTSWLDSFEGLLQMILYFKQQSIAWKQGVVPSTFIVIHLYT